MEDPVDETLFELDEDLEESLTVLDGDGNVSLTFSEIRITLPIMTKYEKVNVIAERVKQLDNGFKTTIEDVVEKENLFKSYDIAIKEFDLNLLPPYYVKRVLPNNTYELWKHEDFTILPD
jgi:DNA-directed RNA polymerase subunit K/omega